MSKSTFVSQEERPVLREIRNLINSEHYENGVINLFHGRLRIVTSGTKKLAIMDKSDEALEVSHSLENLKYVLSEYISLENPVSLERLKNDIRSELEKFKAEEKDIERAEKKQIEDGKKYICAQRLQAVIEFFTKNESFVEDILKYMVGRATPIIQGENGCQISFYGSRNHRVVDFVANRYLFLVESFRDRTQITDFRTRDNRSHLYRETLEEFCEEFEPIIDEYLESGKIYFSTAEARAAKKERDFVSSNSSRSSVISGGAIGGSGIVSSYPVSARAPSSTADFSITGGAGGPSRRESSLVTAASSILANKSTESRIPESATLSSNVKTPSYGFSVEDGRGVDEVDTLSDFVRSNSSRPHRSVTSGGAMGGSGIVSSYPDSARAPSLTSDSSITGGAGGLSIRQSSLRTAASSILDNKSTTEPRIPESTTPSSNVQTPLYSRGRRVRNPDAAPSRGTL